MHILCIFSQANCSPFYFPVWEFLITVFLSLLLHCRLRERKGGERGRRGGWGGMDVTMMKKERRKEGACLCVKPNLWIVGPWGTAFGTGEEGCIFQDILNFETVSGWTLDGLSWGELDMKKKMARGVDYFKET